MKQGLLLLCLVATALSSCKKDKNSGDSATGVVINQGGCFNTYYLVLIDNPDFDRHSFLRPAAFSSCTSCFDCSNSAYVEMPASFAAPGDWVRFTFVESFASCLSSSFAPDHIKVKNLRKL